jgi:hypothetical protein
MDLLSPVFLSNKCFFHIDSICKRESYNLNEMLWSIIFILVITDISNSFSYDPGYIYLGVVWTDTDGKSIQAHAAGILIDPIDKSYWWYGGPLQTPDVALHSVNCYHSKDLLNWINIGEVLGQKQISIKDHPGP